MSASDACDFGDAYLSEPVARRYGTQHLRPTRRLSHRREEAIICRMLGPAQELGLLLDAPCGGGRFTGGLQRLGYRVVSIDRAPGMAAMVAENGSRHVVLGSLASLPFRDACFEAVLCARFLHHMPSAAATEAYLRELARVARRVVVVSAWIETPFTRWRRTRKARTSTRHLMGAPAFLATCEAAGLVVEARARHVPVWAPTTYFRLTRADRSAPR